MSSIPSLRQLESQRSVYTLATVANSLEEEVGLYNKFD